MIYSNREVNEQIKRLRKEDQRSWTDWEASFFKSVENEKAEDLTEKQRQKISQIYDRYCD